MRSRRIDVHTHMIPDFWAKARAARFGQPSWGTPAWSPESTFELMDRLEIQTSILSLSAPSLLGWGGQERLDTCRRVNDFGAGLSKQYPGRFGFFATLALPDVDGAIAELRRASDELGADGVVLMSNYDGVYLGDEQLAPIWDELDRRGAVVFVHPCDPQIKPLPGIPGPVVDFPADTTRTAISLVSGGVMERCKSIKVILSHAGGFLPYAATRFASLGNVYVSKDKSEKAWLRDLKTFYFDTALSTPNGLPSLMAFAAPGHVLFGSDHPYVPPSVLTTFNHELDAYDGFTPGQLLEINRGNACAVFPRLQGTVR